MHEDMNAVFIGCIQTNSPCEIVNLIILINNEMKMYCSINSY